MSMPTTTVRAFTLQCSSCRQWLPDRAFWRQASSVARRGRQSRCTTCSSAKKAANDQITLGVVTRTPDQMGRDDTGKPRVSIFTPWPSQTRGNT